MNITQGMRAARPILRLAGENAGLRDKVFTEKLVVVGKNIVTAASSSPAASIDQTPPL